MQPQRIDWNAFNNEAWAAAIGVEFADGTSFDWSQYSAIEMQVKADALQPEADLSLSLGAGLAIRPGDNSTLEIEVPLEQAELFAGAYAYDIVGTNGGEPAVIVFGEISVFQGVTR